MLRAEDAKRLVMEYNNEQSANVIHNLLDDEDNRIALEIFEGEIYHQAINGNSELIIDMTKEGDLSSLFRETDISEILMHYGFNILAAGEFLTNMGQYHFYTITWK